jgi:hypothetical protein
MLFAAAEVVPLSESTEFGWNVARLAAAGVALAMSLLLGALLASRQSSFVHRLRMLTWALAWFFLFGIQILMMSNTGGPIGRWEYVLSTVILGAVYSANAVIEYVVYWMNSRTADLSHLAHQSGCMSCIVPTTMDNTTLPTIGESPPVMAARPPSTIVG